MNKVNLKIVTPGKQYLKWSLAQPIRLTFKREKQFHNGGIAIKKQTCKINLNKPIYIGASILDLSKVLPQNFHQNYIKNKMLPTDADSLMYILEAENVYEDFCKDKELFDFSNFPKDSEYYNNANNLVIGEMKDETCGIPIKGFVGLKSKMSFITKENHESKKAKYIFENIVDGELKYEDYKNVLLKR